MAESDKSLEKLKKKRATLRALTSKLIAKIETDFNEQSEVDVEELNDKYDQLVDKAAKLKLLDEDIEGLLDIEFIESEVNASESYQENCLKYIKRMFRALKVKNDELKIKNTAAISGSNGDDIQNLVPISSLNVEEKVYRNWSPVMSLPKLTIGKFSGDAYKWTEFWNTYENAIHSCESLSKIEKFTYLKSLLDRPALNVVSGFALTGDNYDNCIELLKDRYGRKDVIINAHINKLLNIEPVKYSADVQNLRKLYDQCEIHIRNLSIIGVSSGSYGHILSPLLLKLLPDDLKLEFHRKRSSGDQFDITDLISFIRREVECREATLLLDDKKWVKNKYPLKFEAKKPFIKMPISTAFNANVQNSCLFCSGKHDTMKCRNSSPLENYDKIKAERRCFKCFKRYHMSKFCRSNHNECKKCRSKSHHELICTSSQQNQIDISKFEQRNIGDEINRSNSCLTETQNETQNETVVSSISHCHNKGTVLLQTGSAEIVSKGKHKVIRFILDSASMRSFITKSDAKEMNLPVVRKEKTLVYTFGSNNPIEREYDVVEVQLRSLNNSSNVVNIEALVTEQISGASLNCPNKTIRKMLSLKGLSCAELPFSYGKKINVLIGADYYFQINTGRIIRLNKKLTAIEGLFGYTVQGRNTSEEESVAMNCLGVKNKIGREVTALNVNLGENGDITNSLKMLWQLEGLGIMSTDENVNESEILKRFNKEIKLKDGRYEVKLPFKTDIEVSDNYNLARNRFFRLLNKFKLQPELYAEYEKIIESQLEEGIIEPINLNDNDKSNNKYYMPHHPVIRQDKETTKVRIVFDASSREKSCLSLNDSLHAGPNLNPNLLDIILKFRMHKIGFIADIEKAFLQISLAEEHRDFARFIWMDGCPPKRLKEFRMKRVTFGVTASPFLLAATIKYHLTKYKHSHPKVFKILNEELYVDDLISGSDNVEEALSLSMKAKVIMGEAKMNLRKWRSNSKELSRLWQGEHIEPMPTEKQNLPVKILGVIWDTENDEFKVEVSSICESMNKLGNTKRNVLQISGRLFDPVGSISPFIIRSKILFQELWESGIGWDEELPNNLKLKWLSWCKEVPLLNGLRINRCYFRTEYPINKTNVQIHIFCDASQVAYGAVVYCRYKIGDCKWGTTLMVSKARVAPLKKLTLPRLELMGALIAARLASHLKGVFPWIQEMYMWSDSQIVLHWIKGSAKQWKPFVSNRVIEIQERTEPISWNHCKGRDNPADIITRGCAAEELIQNSRWWFGPDWLSQAEESWPKGKTEKFEDKSMAERRIQKSEISIHLINERSDVDDSLNTVINKPENKTDQLILRYSNWSKLRRIVAYCSRFIDNMKNPPNRSKGFLSTEELNKATYTVIRIVQESEFPNEYNSLKARRGIPSNSKLISLNPFIDENGVMRVGGRLKNANISENRKHPAILPKCHHVTELIIRHYHEIYLHGGVQLLNSVLREQFWIINAKSVIRRYISKCFKCCRCRADLNTQLMADLPASRVNPCRPFSKIGVDFAGPFHIKSRKGRGVKTTKCYVCLYICFATKAIHLEIVSDLSSEAFIASLKRFTARRGRPCEIYSDCGTNFVAANKELNKMIGIIKNDKNVHAHLATENTKWIFNPPSAPHFGGLWEAGIKSMKHHLKRTVGIQILTYEEFLTLIIQIEACLNSRPLVPVSSDPNDFEVLTPGHFLVGTSLTTFPESDMNQQKLSVMEHWKIIQRLFQSFWKRWSADYLSQLQQRPKWRKIRPNVKINDLVLIKDDNQPPLKWKLGRVVELFPGADGNVRVVNLKTSTGVLKRSINKLCLMPPQDNNL